MTSISGAFAHSSGDQAVAIDGDEDFVTAALVSGGYHTDSTRASGSDADQLRQVIEMLVPSVQDEDDRRDERVRESTELALSDLDVWIRQRFVPVTGQMTARTTRSTGADAQ